MLVKMKNDREEIARLCDEVKKFCDDNAVPEERYHNMVLILDELVTNVISYAYPEGGEHIFTVEFKKESDERVLMEIVDDGIPFDPLARDNPDTESSLEEREIGGLGIFLVKQLSEDVKYSRIDDKNHLSITVSILNNDEE